MKKMGEIDQKTIEEIARKVAASVKGVTQEQVKQIIELKLSNPVLGYREIGKRVGLKKDKVWQVWKMAEPMLALAKEIPKEPERPRDEGEFYSEAFSMIERFLKRGLKPADIVIGLVKKLKISPEKAREAVEKYFEQKRLNVIDLERKWEGFRRKAQEKWRKIDELDEYVQVLLERSELGVEHGKFKMENCIHHQESDGTCNCWIWKDLPTNYLIRENLVRVSEGWHLRVRKVPEYCVDCPTYRRKV
jgi:hypothetical protein